jgi:hypothetical protein
MDLFFKHTDTSSIPSLIEKIAEMSAKSAAIISNILPNPKEVYDER